MKVNGKTMIHEITHTCGHYAEYTQEEFEYLFGDMFLPPIKSLCQDCRKKEALEWLDGLKESDKEIKPGEIRLKTEMKQKGGTYHFRITHKTEPPKTFNQALENFRLAVDELGKEFINLVLKIFRRF